jgi:hypothetical protein
MADLARAAAQEPRGRAMKRFLPSDALFSAGLMVFTLGYLALDMTYKPALRMVPALVAWIMVILLAIDLTSRSDTDLGRALKRRLNPVPDRPDYPLGRQIDAACWVAGFAAALVLIGILAAVPLFVFAFLHWRGKLGIAASLVGGAGATIFIWLLFALMLRLALYPGLIFGGAS